MRLAFISIFIFALLLAPFASPLPAISFENRKFHHLTNYADEQIEKYSNFVKEIEKLNSVLDTESFKKYSDIAIISRNLFQNFKLDIESMETNLLFPLITDEDYSETLSQVLTSIVENEKVWNLVLNDVILAPEENTYSGLNTRFPDFEEKSQKAMDAMESWNQLMLEIHVDGASKVPMRYFKIVKYENEIIKAQETYEKLAQTYSTPSNAETIDDDEIVHRRKGLNKQ